MDVLDFSLRELGMKGIMVLSNVNGKPLDHPSLEAFREAADELEPLVYVHPTVPDAPHHDGTGPSLNALEPFDFDPAERSAILSGRARALLAGERI